MSANDAVLRWFRVYSADRKIRKAVGATSLKEFITEAKKKLEIKNKVKVTVVLEEDGTIVDEEDYFQQGVVQNDILMILKSGEVWADSVLPLVATDVDQDEPDCADIQGTNDNDLRLRNLACRLRTDLKQILLFDISECQLIVDADCDQLSRLLHRSRLEVESIQASCQRHVDQQAEFQEACDVIKLAKQVLTSGTVQASQSLDEPDGSTRKRKKKI